MRTSWDGKIGVTISTEGDLGEAVNPIYTPN